MAKFTANIILVCLNVYLLLILSLLINNLIILRKYYLLIYKKRIACGHLKSFVGRISDVKR